jgi:8-oxo-dGTP diphosphatase
MAERRFPLETPRLRLRPLAEDDHTALFDLYANWEVARNLVRIRFPFTHEAADDLIAAAQVAREQASAYLLGIVRSGSVFVGVAALGIPANAPQSTPEERAEDHGLGILGYAITRAEWGQGFATEVAHRMVAFAFEECGLKRLQASAMQSNAASIQVLRRVGFQLDARGIAETPLSGGPDHILDRYVLMAPGAAGP